MRDIKLVVAAAETIADDVRRVTLAAPGGERLPSYPPGSHLGLRWRAERPSSGPVNSYSLTGDGDSPVAYTISVLRVEDGNGGSAWVHSLEPGDVVEAIAPRSSFAPVATARKHLLIAGGIGVTPLLSHARWHARWGNEFSFYYVHKPGRAAHLEELREICGRRLGAFSGKNDFWTTLGPALARQPLGTHLYICGPRPMIDAVTAATAALRWPRSRVQVEAFGVAEGPREPFRVRLASGRPVDVSADESLLEALERAGVAVPSMCRQGVCGECRTPVAGGRVDHRDLVLSDGEKDGWIMPCVSRAADAEELELRL
jgi:ferredoxin-NADP reductase